MDRSYRRSFQQILDREKIRAGNILEFNSVATIKQCILEGVGITVLPEISVTEDIARGRLAALAWEEKKLEVATLMVWYKERWLSPILKAFMGITREVFKKKNN